MPTYLSRGYTCCRCDQPIHDEARAFTVHLPDDRQLPCCEACGELWLAFTRLLIGLGL
jgi:hypothetical protein